jgi:hypothetical protein
MLPTNGRPVVEWRIHDSAFVDIAEGIESLIQHHFTLPAPSVPVYQAPPEYRPPGLLHASPTPTPMHEASSAYESISASMVSRTSRPLAVDTVVVRLNDRSVLDYFWPDYDLSLISMKHLLAQPLMSAHNRAPRDSFRFSLVKWLTQSQLVWGRITIHEMLGQLSNSFPFLLLQSPIPILLSIQRFIFGRFLSLLYKRVQETAYESFLVQQYYESALIAYERTLRANPFDDMAYRGKGYALYRLGRYDEALEAFASAVDSDPHPDAYAGMSNTLAKVARYDEALVAYERAVKLDLTYATAYSEMADTLEQLGRSEEAQQAHEKAKQYGYEA